MNELLKRIIKNSPTKYTSVLSESEFFKDKDNIPTDLPILNLAFSGDLSGGLSSGLTILSGVSKTFKTLLGLYCVKAYLDKYPESVCVFYDSEGGITPEYLSLNGIDTGRIIHVPIEHLEMLKFDMVKTLKGIERSDKLIIMIDSIGNTASLKELEDAENEKSVAEMQRAKTMKGLFRMVTPALISKDVPCIAVAHTYQTMCLAGETLIKTTEGLKGIKDIQVGDSVFTNNGNAPVIRTYGPEDLNPEGKVFVELEFHDGSIVKCTHDHKFLVQENWWVEAADLELGQKMAVGKMQGVNQAKSVVGKKVVEEFPIYDIEVKGDHCFELHNGVIAHNSMYPTAVISGGCLVEGTRIRMDDGSLTEIQNVQVGDLVLTISGPQKVTHTWNPKTLEEGTPECYEIEFTDGYKVTCSDAHPFLCPLGWIKAKDLLENQEVIVIPGEGDLYVKAIKGVGRLPVYDISVETAEHYVLENGAVVHNSGLMYASNQAFIITKSQEKDGTDLVGYNFTINIEKSRYVREKSKFLFTVKYDGGIQKYSGLMDLAIESGLVIKPNQGYYQKINRVTGEAEGKKFRLKETDNPDFWNDLLESPEFNSFLNKRFKIGGGGLLNPPSEDSGAPNIDHTTEE